MEEKVVTYDILVVRRINGEIDDAVEANECAHFSEAIDAIEYMAGDRGWWDDADS